MFFLMSSLLSHAFTSYEAWDRIGVGSLYTYESVTLQLSGTDFKIGMTTAKSIDRIAC
jgi:hypothetical protein